MVFCVFFVNRDADKACAIVERKISDTCDAAWNCDTGQARAAQKCAGANACNTVRDGDTHNAGAITKGVLLDTRNRQVVINIRDGYVAVGTGADPDDGLTFPVLVLHIFQTAKAFCVSDLLRH